MQLVTLQKQLLTGVRAKALEDALQERRWTDARQIAAEILDSNAAPGLKAQVRRTLSDLDRRKLGKPKAAK